MDERKATVLRAVVESFIDTALPVGSRAVSELADLDVSAATIRNDMAALEHDGFLMQPHTSAGRVPTEAGYRYFVDSLGPGRLDVTETRLVRAFFEHAQGQLERRLVDTSRLLSQLTTYAAVVVGPSHDPAKIRSAQIVDLGDGRALVVVITSSGSVERSMFTLPTDADGDAVARASAAVNDALVGRSLTDGLAVPSTGDDVVDGLVAAGLASVEPADVGGGDVYVGGAAKVAGQFEAIETVSSVLALLEEQLMVVSLLGGLVQRGISVAIGTETGLESLSECSVVVAPYAVDGEQVGTIGLLGPTRMDYPRALAAVQVVSSRLGESLGLTHED